MKTPTPTVADLIAVLQSLPADAPVRGAWEGQQIPVYDVLLVNGVVLLDVEYGGLRDDIELTARFEVEGKNKYGQPLIPPRSNA